VAPANPPEAIQEAAGPAAPEEEFLSMKGTEFYLYDARPMAGAARKPLMTIKAGELDVGMAEENSVSFKKARATIRSGDPDDPEIVFQAAEGSFVENERAYLKGGVVAQVGDMTVQLQDIEMNSPTEETPVVAESANPVIIDGPGMHLEAQSLRLYPDEKSFEMTAGSGYFDFGRIQP
jgi:hypothetical protein